MQQLKTAIRTTDLQSSWVLHLFVYAYVTFVFVVGPLSFKDKSVCAVQPTWQLRNNN